MNDDFADDLDDEVIAETDEVELDIGGDRSLGGELILVATPIGNLGDVSTRVIAALQNCDAIACEDTRHSRKLLSALHISGKRLLAVHEHNESAAAAGLVSLIQQGQTIALVTDAGTPGISDPGQRVVSAVAAAGYRITCIPGASAVVVALAVSGLPTDRFVFEGFLPRSGRDRRERLAALQAEPRTMVFYESPQRIVKTLSDFSSCFGGERRVSVSRELTKKFETTWRGVLAAAVSEFSVNEPRGEFVVVVAGSPVIDGGAKVQIDEADVLARIDRLRADGFRTRDAVDAVVGETGIPRRVVYAIATGASKSSDDGAVNRGPF
jgi:16S rRNA (cytidine1402-2'-O)-methyltransferase